jgi:MFS family permease
VGSSGSSTRAESIWSANFIVLCIVNLCQVMGQQMMTTIIPLYAYDLGAASGLIGFVTGSFAITALITRPFIAPAFDSYSKKKIFCFASLLITVCSFLYGIANTVPLVIAVRMLHGLAMGCTGPLALALACETLPESKMASGISVFSLAQALSQAVGPMTGLYLIGVIGYQWTFIIAGIAMACSAALSLTVKENVKIERPKYKFELSRCFVKAAIPAAILTAITTGANMSIMSFIAIYGGLLGIDQIGLYFTVNATCLLVTRPFFGKLADKYGYSKVIIPAMCLFALSFVIIAMADTLWMFLIAAVVGACGFGVVSPLLQALSMQCVPRKRSGAASATNYTGLDLAMLLGATVSGGIAEVFYGTSGNEITGYSDMYLVNVLFVAVALVLFLFMRKFMARNIESANKQNEKDEKARLEALAARKAEAKSSEE